MVKEKTKISINVFVNSSSDDNTSLIVRNSYLRTNYTESSIEEDIDMKNQYRIKNLPCPKENTDSVCKLYDDSRLDDPSTSKNNANVYCNDKNLENGRFLKVNSLPAVREHLTPKFYVCQAFSDRVNESSLLGLNPSENFKLDEHDSIFRNSTLIYRGG